MSAPSRISGISSQQPKAPAPSMLSAAALSAGSPGIGCSSRQRTMQPAMKTSTFHSKKPAIEVFTALRARRAGIDPSCTTKLPTLSPPMVYSPSRRSENFNHHSRTIRLEIWSRWFRRLNLRRVWMSFWFRLSLTRVKRFCLSIYLKPGIN